MSKSNPRRSPKKSRSGRDDSGTAEDRPAEAITIAWIASVTSVLLANLVTIATHFYAARLPESKTARPFEAIMLLTGCVLGIASLALLAVVWRVSRLKPPRGFVVFAALVAAAPIIVTVARLSMR
jgi:hypothetical protein